MKRYQAPTTEILHITTTPIMDTSVSDMEWDKGVSVPVIDESWPDEY